MFKSNRFIKIYFSNLENDFFEYKTKFSFENNPLIIKINEIGKKGGLYGKMEEDSVYLFGNINNFGYEFVLDKIKENGLPKFFGKYTNLEKKIKGEALLEILD